MGKPRKTQRQQGPVHERVLKRTDRSGECWLFTGYRDKKGYGVVKIQGGTTAQAHRAVYEALVGPVPDGFDVHHLCGETACVRPDHLGVVEHVAHAREHKNGQGRP